MRQVPLVPVLCYVFLGALEDINIIKICAAISKEYAWDWFSASRSQTFYSQPIQIFFQLLGDRCAQRGVRRCPQLLNGKVPIRCGLLSPGLERSLAHVSFHVPGVVFFVGPLVEFPGVFVLKLFLEDRPGSYLPASLLCFTRSDALTVDCPVPLV